MKNKSTTQKLQELFELYQSGALTKEEFDSLKSELLGLGGTSNIKENDSSNRNDHHFVVPKSTNSLPNESKNDEQHSEISNQSKVNLTKKKKKSFLLISSLVIVVAVIAILFVIHKKSNEVTDIDGNVYHTVTIGTQVWMAENLKTTKFRNGDPISNVSDIDAWYFTNEAYCWYNNDETLNKATYGALYNWKAVADSRNIAPIGWHVASDDEWKTLISFLGESNAGGMMKEANTAHWKSPNTGATNSSDFTALPGGLLNIYGPFYGLGEDGIWWSSTDYDVSNAWNCQLVSYNAELSRKYSNKKYGFSVRCVRD